MSRTRLLLIVVAVISVVAGWPQAQQLQKVTIN